METTTKNSKKESYYQFISSIRQSVCIFVQESHYMANIIYYKIATFTFARVRGFFIKILKYGLPHLLTGSVCNNKIIYQSACFVHRLI